MITFSNDVLEVELSVSYLTDFINELVIKTAIILEGSSKEIIQCYYEPGQYILTLERQKEKISIIIEETRSSGNINIFSGSDQLLTFGRTLLREIERMKNEIGIKQYLKSWKYDYPEEGVERLRRAIKLI